MAKTIEKLVYHFDERDNQLGVLQQMSDCFREFDVNKATDTLTVQTKTFVDKHHRLVVQGRNGGWLEYIVEGPSDDDTGQGGTYVGELSMNELGGHYIDDRRPTGDCAGMVAIALEGTRWESLGSDIHDDPVTQVWYHTNSLAALTRIASTFGGEIRYEYEVEGGRVTHRRVGVFKRVGSDRGRSFEYARDLLGVSRECEPEPIYTRVYGYGSGVEAFDESGQATGGYTRKITFADINGGKPYIESDEARERFGIPNAEGGMDHYEGKVEFDDCKDPAELLKLTTEWAEAQWEPQWSYTVDVLALDGDPLDRGDDAMVYDRMYDPVLTIKERVVQGHEDFLRPENDEYTLGKVNPMVSDMLVEQEQTQQGLTDKTDNLGTRTEDIEDRSEGWDQTTDTVTEMPGEWLRQQMDRINQEMNAAKTYKFTSFEKGDIWANGPLTEDGKPDGATAAIALNGLGFRIAGSVEGGDFNWTTFGTGEGFTATCINVGTLRCGDNFLNLDTGEMRIALTATVGTGNTSISGYVQNVSNTAANNAKNEAISQADQNTQDYLEDYVSIVNFDSYLDMENTFNALTHDGRDKGFFIQSNQVFINADFVRTGVLQSQNGMSVWDLNNGYFETASSGWSGGQFHGIHTRIAGGQYAVKMDSTDIGTMSTFSSGNVHPFGIKVFTDLVFASPGGIGVSHNSTQDSGLTYQCGIQQTIGVVTGVSGGDSISVARSNLRFDHGLLVAATSNANATFSTPAVEHISLAASTEPIDGIGAGGAIPIELVSSSDQLMQAADEARPVWQVEPENLQLGIPVYTGEEWTMGVPTEDPTDDPGDVEVPTMALVNAQAEAVQTQIEAIASALGGALGTTQAKALRASLATVRTAVASGSAAEMRTAARATAARTEAM